MKSATGTPKLLTDTAHFSTIYTGCFNDAGALKRILDGLRPHCTGRLICLFGGRDGETRESRRTTGEMAGRCADLVILTGDPCCKEHPDTVNRDFADGLSACGGRYELIADRIDAIHSLIDHCERNDAAILLRRCPDADSSNVCFLSDEQIATQYLEAK